VTSRSFRCTSFLGKKIGWLLMPTAGLAGRLVSEAQPRSASGITQTAFLMLQGNKNPTFSHTHFPCILCLRFLPLLVTLLSSCGDPVTSNSCHTTESSILYWRFCKCCTPSLECMSWVTYLNPPLTHHALGLSDVPPSWTGWPINSISLRLPHSSPHTHHFM
jgi:hypothetical protein